MVNMKGKMEQWVRYLQQWGFPLNLSVETFARSGPGKLLVWEILTFLLRRIGIILDPRDATFRDDVIMAFQTLRYHWRITKASLDTPGADAFWPKWSEAIGWLVQVLIFWDEEEQFNSNLDEADQNEDKVWLTSHGNVDRIEQQFYKFLRKSMVAFLNDDSEKSKELEGELLDMFGEDCEKVEQYVTELDDECGKMKEDIAAMRKEVNG